MLEMLDPVESEACFTEFLVAKFPAESPLYPEDEAVTVLLTELCLPLHLKSQLNLSSVSQEAWTSGRSFEVGVTGPGLDAALDTGLVISKVGRGVDVWASIEK